MIKIFEGTISSIEKEIAEFIKENTAGGAYTQVKQATSTLVVAAPLYGGSVIITTVVFEQQSYPVGKGGYDGGKTH